MNIRSFLDDAISRGEKIRDEVLSELVKSKTIRELVANRNFIKAMTRVIETKDEIRRVIGNQVKNIFDIMDLPTKAELKKITHHLGKLEQDVDRIARKNIAIRTLPKTQFASKARTANRKIIKGTTGKKTRKR